MATCRNKIIRQRILGIVTLFIFLFSPLTPILAQDTSTAPEVIEPPAQTEEVIVELTPESPETLTETQESQEENQTIATTTPPTESSSSGDFLVEKSASATSTTQDEIATTTTETSITEEQGLETEVIVDEPEPESVATETTKEVIEEAPIPTEKIKTNKSLSIDAQLEQTKKKLEARKVPQEIIDRIDAFKARKDTQITPEEPSIVDRVQDLFTETPKERLERKRIEKEANKRPFKVKKAPETISVQNESAFDAQFGDGVEKKSLKQRFKDLLEVDSLSDAQAYLFNLFGNKAIAQVSNDPNDYLAEEQEIQFSQAIQNLATELNNDPLEILNYVRNNIEFEPYYGSKKGSDATLVERSGNDIDQATLLIALLRQSNIPARYKTVNAKMDIRTVTDLLGVQNAESAGQILSAVGVPYILYIDSEQNPLFFVMEHTYVEAHIPYGYSRGADASDGGNPQWVPIDPSINAYYYEQLADIVEEMNLAGFDIQLFLENYIDANYGTSTPVEAFKQEVVLHLATNPPQFYPDLTYDEALVRKYASNNNFDFIPGALPYEIVTDLGTHQTIPNNYRHTLELTVLDELQTVTELNTTQYISDIANTELTLTYDAATPADQQTIDSFATIYDVVPLSAVNVLPTLKVNGTQVAQGASPVPLGINQFYTVEFYAPERSIGQSIQSILVDSPEKAVIVGNTEAIAINTGDVPLPELRPTQDVQSSSFVNAQKLYKTAHNYLYRLDQTQEELAKIIGSDYQHVATRATVFNGIDVTYQSNEPYSFEWKGLRIDSSATVVYLNRFNPDVNTHIKEFQYVFGLQASQDESDIFEEDYTVESVATVKGLKLINDGTIAGDVLKINSTNESIIDALSVSTSTRNIFHTIVQSGNTIYTPTAPVTYQDWTGLFYINLDTSNGNAGYIIGEGLNGGYTVEQFPTGWSNFWREYLLPNLVATINAPQQGQTFTQGDTIYWSTFYDSSIHDWNEELELDSRNYSTGNVTLKSGYGTSDSVGINIQKTIVGEPGAGGNDTFTFDELIKYYMDQQGLPPGVLKVMIGNESANQRFSTRYEPCQDISLYEAGTYNTFPYTSYIIGGGGDLTTGDGAKDFAQNNPKGYTPKQMIEEFSLRQFRMPNTLAPTVYEVWDANRDFYWYCTGVTPQNGNYPAQFLVATSYGLGQVLYSSALLEGFNTSSTTARTPWDLMGIDLNVKFAAEHLKSKYINATNNAWGDPVNECRVIPYNNNYFTNLYGANWIQTLLPEYNPGGESTQLWDDLQNELDEGKDRLWWAVRLYNGLAPASIKYGNDVCGTYHLQNP